MDEQKLCHLTSYELDFAGIQGSFCSNSWCSPVSFGEFLPERG